MAIPIHFTKAWITRLTWRKHEKNVKIITRSVYREQYPISHFVRRDLGQKRDKPDSMQSSVLDLLYANWFRLYRVKTQSLVQLNY